MSRTTRWIAVTTCLMALGGCQQKATSGLQAGQVVGGATEQMAVSVPANGFLPSPQLLTPGAPGQADFTYLNSNVQPRSYTAVMVDPVTIWADQGSSLNTTTPAQRQQLANLASSDLRNASWRLPTRGIFRRIDLERQVSSATNGSSHLGRSGLGINWRRTAPLQSKLHADFRLMLCRFLLSGFAEFLSNFPVSGRRRRRWRCCSVGMVS
jgi:hypothetical protein